MRNILFLHSGAELYGADQILLKLLKNIDKNEYNPIVILPNEGPFCEELKKNNIKFYIITYPIVRRKYFNFKGIISYFSSFFKESKKIINICKKEKIDIIHTNTIAVLEGAYVHKKTKIPLIYHVHEMIDKPKIIAKILYKIAVYSSDKVIVVSNSVKKHIKSMIKIKKDNIVVIHNGLEKVDYERIDVGYLYKELNIPNDSIVVASIGRINAIKGQSHFIEALEPIIKKNKRVYGLIIGDAFNGEEWRVDELKKIIAQKECSNNIKYLGFRDDVINIEKLMNVFVLSSINFDSFPTVVLESMRFNKPVVAYKCGGVEEMIIDSENGYLVEMGDCKELTKKIELAIEKKMNIKSNYFKNNFSIEKFIKKISLIYDELNTEKNKEE